MERLRVRALVAHRLPLAAIFLGAFYLAVSYAAQARQWAVMTDELQTSKLATSAARSLSPVPHIHGEYYGALSQLYPLLIAPFFGLMSTPHAVTAAHVANALLLASAAGPAYLLAREITGSRQAGYVAAALTAFVPWLVLSTTLLTENAAYPAFVWALWLSHRTLVEPTVGRDAAALGGLVVAYLARTQLFVLAVALPAALLAHELAFAIGGGPRLPALRHGLRRAVAAHPLLAAVYAAAGAGGAVLAAIGSLSRVFGTYGETLSGDLLPPGIWHAAAVHFDYVVVGVGIAPFLLASGWSLTTALRPERRETHAFAVLLLALVPLLTLEAASFDLRFTPGGFVQDRYLCYLAPLFAVGSAAALLEQRRRGVLVALALGLGVGFFWLAGLAPYRNVTRIYWASPAAAFHVSFAGAASALGLSLKGLVQWGSLVVAAGLALLLWRAGRGLRLAVVGGAVAAFGATEAAYVFDRAALEVTTRSPTIGGVRRDWIDARLHSGSVALVPSLRLVPDYWWDAEFWNERVDRVLSVDGGTTLTPFPATRVTIDPKTGVTEGDAPTSVLVVDEEETRFRFAGTKRIARAGPLELVRVARPYRAVWLTRGTTPDGWTLPRRRVQLRLFGGERPGLRQVDLTLSASDASRGRQSVTLRSDGAVQSGGMAPGRSLSFRFKACAPKTGFTSATLLARGSVRLSDGRVVGVHLDRIEARATGRGCASRR
jgi:hypothetical protein